MTNLAVFSFHEAHDVRIQTIDAEFWFCLRDVCTVVDLDSRAASKFGLDLKGVAKLSTPSNGGKQQVTFINEPNLYRVIFRSNKPEARVFQDWIFNDVLPSLRKTGQYAMPCSHTPCNKDQLAAIDRMVQHIAKNYAMDTSASAACYNHLRNALNIKNVKDLPAERHTEAMQILQRLNAASFEYMKWSREVDERAIDMILRVGQPWTPTIVGKLKKQLGLAVGHNPDWQKLATLVH